MIISRKQYNKLPENLQDCFSNGNIHPTIKNLKLLKYLCTLTKPPSGGIVLDPFLGSGTTAMACKLIGRDYIGFELEEDYYNIALKRIASVKPEKSKPIKKDRTLF